MIVVDSSVWVAHFRNLASRQVVLRRALFRREELLVDDIILLKVLRGARTSAMPCGSYAVCTPLMLGGAIAGQAAWNFRALRAAGITIRSSPDLIIGTYCIEHRHTLLHDDRDFGPMHEHLGLQVL